MLLQHKLLDPGGYGGCSLALPKWQGSFSWPVLCRCVWKRLGPSSELKRFAFPFKVRVTGICNRPVDVMDLVVGKDAWEPSHQRSEIETSGMGYSRSQRRTCRPGSLGYVLDASAGS